jgi:choline-glycine betaine transporter
MERVRVIYFYVRSFEGGSTRLCRLRTMLIGPCGTSIDYILVHMGLWGLTNLVALTVTELDDTLSYLTDVYWDSVWVTHGCPSRYRMEDVH